MKEQKTDQQSDEILKAAIRAAQHRRRAKAQRPSNGEDRGQLPPEWRSTIEKAVQVLQTQQSPTWSVPPGVYEYVGRLTVENLSLKQRVKALEDQIRLGAQFAVSTGSASGAPANEGLTGGE